MPALSPDREAELETERERQRNLWRIGEKYGLPTSEADKVWSMVLLEMKFHCGDYQKALSVAEHARRWIENQNPHHIDAAFVICQQIGIAPPPALVSLNTEVAGKRMGDKIRGGTAAKVRREAQKDHALTVMACLCAAGLSIREASRKAAVIHREKFGKTYMASTLETEYSKAGQPYRKLSSNFADYWTTPSGKPVLDEWLVVIPRLPACPPELWGEPD